MNDSLHFEAAFPRTCAFEEFLANSKSREEAANTELVAEVNLAQNAVHSLESWMFSFLHHLEICSLSDHNPMHVAQLLYHWG
jgi:hypothetical protein